MPRKKKLEDLNGSKLKKGQKRLTPGQFTPPSYESLQPRTARHPDLAPLTLSGLIDAFRLNEIPFTHHLEGQYECHVEAGGLRAEINPYDGAEVLQFFRDVICRR